MKYEVILTMKETEKATVVLATLEGHTGPVVVKRLKGGKADIYRLLCHAKNPNIPEIYEVEETEDGLLVAEEHIAGEPLDVVLGKCNLSDREKLSLALQLCNIVAFLHGLTPPVIHRDIKPSNILVTKDGTLKLIDFDASRWYREEKTSNDTRLLGTAEYAPPEQFGYAQTDVRSDIYSMGVVFRDIRFEKKYLQRKWERIVRKCTNFAPEHRYQNVLQLKKEIERMQSEMRFYVVGAIGVLMVLAIVFAIGMPQGQTEPAGENTTLSPEPTKATTSTPKPTATVTPTETPTSTPTPTETPIPTNTLTPTSTVTMAPTLTPTLTLTPTPTNTPTPTLTAEEIAKYQEEIATYLKESNRTTDKYCRGSGNYFIYSSFFEGEEIVKIEFSNIMTQELIELSEEDFVYENSIVQIPAQFLETLEDLYYEVGIYGPNYGRDGVRYSTWLQVVSEKCIELPFHVETMDLDYYVNRQEKLHVILRNESDKLITGLYFGRTIKIEEERYTILYDGKALELSRELLAGYADRGSVDFFVLLDDGTKERVTVYFLMDE